MSATRTTLTTGSLLVLAVLFVALIILSNMFLRGARLDLTENHLYTLSEGTRNILGDIDEPINLYFFYSERASRDIPVLRTYATRVRELLDEFVQVSKGQLNLHVIDPLPFSEDEDRAAQFGLQSIPVGANNETVYFGLAGTNSTDGLSSSTTGDPAPGSVGSVVELTNLREPRRGAAAGLLVPPWTGAATGLPFTSI